MYYLATFFVLSINIIDLVSIIHYGLWPNVFDLFAGICLFNPLCWHFASKSNREDDLLQDVCSLAWTYYPEKGTLTIYIDNEMSTLT